MADNSIYKKEHDAVIAYVKSQINVDLNNYRDGDGTNPYTTAYWDLNGPKVCINWCGNPGGMDKNIQNQIKQLVNNSNNKLTLKCGSAWFKYIYFTNKQVYGGN